MLYPPTWKQSDVRDAKRQNRSLIFTLEKIAVEKNSTAGASLVAATNIEAGTTATRCSIRQVESKHLKAKYVGVVSNQKRGQNSALANPVATALTFLARPAQRRIQLGSEIHDSVSKTQMVGWAIFGRNIGYALISLKPFWILSREFARFAVALYPKRLAWITATARVELGAFSAIVVTPALGILNAKVSLRPQCAI